MKISAQQFRERYNIPLSTESKLKKDDVVPYEKIGGHVIYNQETTDKLATEGKLGAKAFIAIKNIIQRDDTEEHH